MADDRPNLKDDLLNELSSSLGPLTDGLEPETSTLPPPVIPDHTLLRRIGKGSYGEVWLARNALGTLRAVKIVHRRAFDSDRPYEREFAGIRRFEPISRTHPSQLNVLQVGRDDAAGHFYYVMELADAPEPPLKCEDGGSESEDGIRAPPAQRHSPSSILDPRDYHPRTLRSELQRRGRLPSCGKTERLWSQSQTRHLLPGGAKASLEPRGSVVEMSSPRVGASAPHRGTSTTDLNGGSRDCFKRLRCPEGIGPDGEALFS